MIHPKIGHLHRFLNWKVLLGLVVIALLIGVIAPPSLWRGIPIVLLLICPLVLLFMMRSMSNEGQTDGHGAASDTQRTSATPLPHEEPLDHLPHA